MAMTRFHLGLWARARLALVLALTVAVLITQPRPGWDRVLLVFTSWVCFIMRLITPSVLPHQSSIITAQFVVMFLAIAVPLYAALSYVPKVFVSSARTVRRLTRPYATSTSFLVCFVVAGTLGAIVGLFEQTVLFPYSSPVFSLVCAWAGFVVIGWIAAVLWCSVGRAIGSSRSNRHCAG